MSASEDCTQQSAIVDWKSACPIGYIKMSVHYNVWGCQRELSLTWALSQVSQDVNSVKPNR